MLNYRYSLFKFLIFIIGFTFSVSLFSQNNEDKKVIFSGIIFSSDSLTNPLPQVNIVVNKNRGTSSNSQGAFSIKVGANDTIVLTHIGYRSTTVFIPDSVKGGKLIAKLFLVSDTVNIDEVVISSLQNYDDFKSSFLEMENDRELTNAKNNINRLVYEAKTTTEWTVEDNLERGLQKEANKAIYYGQIQTENTIDVVRVVGGLIGLSSSNKKKTKNDRLYREFINLQNQNNLIYVK